MIWVVSDLMVGCVNVIVIDSVILVRFFMLVVIVMVLCDDRFSFIMGIDLLIEFGVFLMVLFI